MERLCGFFFPGEGERVSLLCIDHFKLEVQQTLGEAMLHCMAIIEASILALYIAQEDSPLHPDDPIIQQYLEVNETQTNETGINDPKVSGILCLTMEVSYYWNLYERSFKDIGVTGVPVKEICGKASSLMLLQNHGKNSF